MAAGRLVIDPPPGLLDPDGRSARRGGRMRIDIITIFPEYFSPLGVSLIGKAAERGDIELRRARPADAGRTTCTTPWTTPRSAAARGW